MTPQTSQPAAYLAPGVHMAWRDKDVVVLDLNTDAYACLVGLADRVKPGASPGVVVSEPGLLEQLRLAGVTATTASDHNAHLSARGVLAPSPATTPALKVGAAITAVASTVQFHRNPLPRLVRIVRARNMRLSSVDHPAAAQALGAYLSIQPWMPYAGDCLQRAFMLHAQLHAHGVPARWVFGIRTWPFAAHCWIQIDDRVLGDSLDRARSFTPILSV